MYTVEIEKNEKQNSCTGLQRNERPKSNDNKPLKDILLKSSLTN